MTTPNEAPDGDESILTRWPRKLWRSLLAVPLALWIFFEEWIWVHVLNVVTWVAKLPPIRWAESFIAKLPPYVALIAFVIPAIVLLPFKLVALWLIAHGHAVYGVCVFIIAKLIGTAFLARIFMLTKPALMTIGWFARAYNAFIGWKTRLYDYVRALPVYLRLRAWVREMRATVKAWWVERK